MGVNISIYFYHLTNSYECVACKQQFNIYMLVYDYQFTMFGSLQFRSLIGNYFCVLKFSFITFKHYDAHNFSFPFIFTFLVHRSIRNISFKNYYFFSDWAKEQIPFSDWAKRDPFFRNHCPSVKKFLFTLSQKFSGQACLPEFVESGHSGTCGNDFCDGGFNGTLGLKNYLKNSKMASSFASMASQ